MFRQPSRKAIKILREALEHLPECLRRMSKSTTEKGFDMDYFGSMLIHFEPEDSAQ